LYYVVVIVVVEWCCFCRIWFNEKNLDLLPYHYVSDPTIWTGSILELRSVTSHVTLSVVD